MLGTTATISMQSDAELATDITQRQLDHIAARPAIPQKARISPAVGLNGLLTLRPISAMLELARGTALNDDPQIAAFARRWSTLRYLGIFGRDHATRSLHLDNSALPYIGPNQRRVLSEDLGIGFGILAAKHWCRTRNPKVGPITAIDVDKALLNGTVPNLQLADRRQPDYLLAYPDPSNPGVMVYELLETKGTVSSSNAKKQLGRAVTQLASLTVDGNPLTGLATSTISNTEGIFVLAVDPEERPVTWELSSEALKRRRVADGRSREDAVKIDTTAEEFLASATNVDNATLAEFSGQYSAASRWLPKLSSRGVRRTNAEVRRTFDAGTFVGTEHLIEIPETRTTVRLYQAVEKQVADGLAGLDASAVVDAQRSFAESYVGEPEVSEPRNDGLQSASAVAINSDGSLLEVSVG